MFVSALVNTIDLSGSRALLNRVREQLYQHQILFFHVPKCAGTSLSHAFRVKHAFSQFRLDEETSRQVVDPADLDRWMAYKQGLFLYHALQGVRFVQGHVHYDPAAFGSLHGRATFMTILREPIDRVISLYHFDRRANEQPFGQFLETHRGRLECSILSRLFGGLPFSAEAPGVQHRDQAIEALRRFDIAGIIEKPEALSALVKQRTGLHAHLPRRNVGKSRLANPHTVSLSDRERLRELCAVDSEIYQAVSRFQGG